MASVVLEHVTKLFQGPEGQHVVALEDVSLTVAERELLVLVGPSGCGKTTTLRLIAGLEEPTSGAISIAGRVVNNLPAGKREVGMVFQNPALYPHMTAYQNMAFGLKLRRCPKAEIERRVKEAAETLGLLDCLDRLPMELSGGQRQRVALGRALVRQPKVFLLDEPLSNLDAPMRTQMRNEIARLHERLGATMVYVTHDQAEAMALGQRIAVMNEGVIQQAAAPLEIYQHPANLFVAGFIGSPRMNFFLGGLVSQPAGLFFQAESVSSDTTRLAFGVPQDALARLQNYSGKKVVLGLRPEHIQRRLAEASPTWSMDTLVQAVEHQGAETYLRLTGGGHSFVARVPATQNAGVGEKTRVVFDMSRAYFFDPDTGRAIH